MFNFSHSAHPSLGSVLATTLQQMTVWLVADERWSSVNDAAIAEKVKSAASSEVPHKGFFKGPSTSDSYAVYSEEYLAQATDISDLESRMANIDRANFSH